MSGSVRIMKEKIVPSWEGLIANAAELRVTAKPLGGLLMGQHLGRAGLLCSSQGRKANDSLLGGTH